MTKDHYTGESKGRCPLCRTLVSKSELTTLKLAAPDSVGADAADGGDEEMEPEDDESEKVSSTKLERL